MKFLQNIFKKFKRKPKLASDIWRDSRFVINHAFTADGVDYYCFDDLVNQPYERALTSIDFYNELQMNVDHEYLSAQVKAIREILTAPKINIFDIHKINEQMAERIGMIRSPELIYKLASVIYFDKNENPTVYDFKYNQEKIKRWKEAFPDGSFFSQAPIRALHPFLVDSEMNFLTYQSLWEKVAKRHLDVLLSHLSESINLSAKNKAKG